MEELNRGKITQPTSGSAGSPELTPLAPDLSQDPLIALEGVTLGYPGKVALQNLTLTVRRGEFLGVIGPNGSGKSTLLKGLLGLVPVLRGRIRILEESRPSKIRKQIGYLPQREQFDSSFPATVLDVVLMGRYSQLGFFRKPGGEDQELAHQCLDLVGMADLASEPFGHLSGGQQQRVLIARALVNKPELLLLDEPTTALDVASQQAITESIEAIRRRTRITVVMVTHDVNLIVPHVDRLAYLRQGRLMALGTPAEVLQEEILSRIYDAEVFVLRQDEKIRVVVGDHHA